MVQSMDSEVLESLRVSGYAYGSPIDMDMESVPQSLGTDPQMMLDAIPSLDMYADSVLNLLLPNYGRETLLKNLQKPGSAAAKRLAQFDNVFRVASIAFGTVDYVSPDLLEYSLGSNKFRLVLLKVNLAVLATFVCTTQQHSGKALKGLKVLDKLFPRGLGEDLTKKSFEIALEIRTQALVVAFMQNQSRSNFDPNYFLEYFFFVHEQGDDDHGPKTLRPWSGTQRSEISWQHEALSRVRMIRQTFQTPPEIGDPVDFEKLLEMFPWNIFQQLVLDYIQASVQRMGDTSRLQELVAEAQSHVVFPESKAEIAVNHDNSTSQLVVQDADKYNNTTALCLSHVISSGAEGNVFSDLPPVKVPEALV